MSAIESIMRQASAVLAAIAAACLVFMMTLTFCDVVGRYVFNWPVYFTIEFTQLAMGIIIYLGLALTTLRRGHISVDVVIANFPPKLRRVVDLIADICVLTVLVAITWLLIDRALTNIADDLRTLVLFMPVFPFALVMAVGAGISSLVALWNIAGSVSRAGA